MTIRSLSVVVPSRNGRHLLGWSLPPLLRDLAALPGAEVIVVDDASTDDTASWLEREYPAVRVLQNENAAGFATACNVGAGAAGGQIVVFLNSDAEVMPGWSTALLDTFERHPSTVIAGGLTVFRENPEMVNSAGIRISPSTSGSDLGLGLPLSEVNLRPREIAGVSGVSLAVRADWFRATGGFDERLFMYFEDVELCIRAWLEGHTVRLAPDAVVRHQAGATAGPRYQWLRNYYGSRNRILVATAALETGAAVRAVLLLVAQDLATVIWLALSGRARLGVRTGAARMRGALAGLRGWPASRRRHREASRRRAFSELAELGIITGWPSSVREFGRLRRRELPFRTSADG